MRKERNTDISALEEKNSKVLKSNLVPKWMLKNINMQAAISSRTSWTYLLYMLGLNLLNFLKLKLKFWLSGLN